MGKEIEPLATEENSFEINIHSSDLLTPKAIFNKKVDWLLLHNGFTIPQNAVDSFCSNISDDIQRGESIHISLSVKGTSYDATLTLSDIIRKTWQVRYSPNSLIAKDLRDIFASTYRLAEAKRNGMIEEFHTDEFVEMLCVSPGLLEIKCFPSTEENDYRIEVTGMNTSALSTIEDRCLIRRILQSRVNEVGLYQAARNVWFLSENKNRLDDIDYVLATVNGEIREVYADLSWSRITDVKFEFEGVVAKEDIRMKYVGKLIPDKYRKSGMESTDLYTFSSSHDSNKQDTTVAQLDFANTESCSGTMPFSCSVRNDNIPCGKNWRDLLAATTEYCISNFPDHMEKLKTEWLTNYSQTPYLLLDKPAFAGKEISNGCWINVNYSISQLIRIIEGVIRYCGINLRDVNITYTSKSGSKTENKSRGQGLDKPSSFVPQEIINALSDKYANGFRFDTTALRLLSTSSGIEINEDIQIALKKALFCRKDDVCFLPDIIADAETRKKIIERADTFLDEYGFFEVPELYAFFAEDINDKCIYDADSFESFYLFIKKRNIRCVTAKGKRIAREQNEDVDTLFSNVANKAILIIKDEFSGCAIEDDLRTHFTAISSELLSIIINAYAEDIIKTEINGMDCYQTLDGFDLPDDFSKTLSKVLSLLDEFKLAPTDEVLHTALTWELKLNNNFKAYYSIPNDETYRRLIAFHYKETPKRKWKYGKFAEVQD